MVKTSSSQPALFASEGPSSAFAGVGGIGGLKATVAALIAEIQELYLADQATWIVGYSGGKDSTAVLALIWRAVMDLPEEQRKKKIHVISTDTLVENPVIAAWTRRAMERMGTEAAEQVMPVEPHLLTPALDDSYWVNLIGRGYSAPSELFRWCTDRLKIRPSTKFINELALQMHGVVLVLGTRHAESLARKARMERAAQGRQRARLTPSSDQPGVLTYTPIELWSNDDVWMFLMQYPSPWAGRTAHKELMGLYRGASEDNDCPLVVEKGTPSCGSSRFGCWVCTVAGEDRSMMAMVRNEVEFEWMIPLLDLRNALADEDWHLRDWRKMNGALQLDGRGKHAGQRLTHGPYTQDARAMWLRRVLQAERSVQEEGPDKSITLIRPEELDRIREIWVLERHEIEDLLPKIYEEVTGRAFAGKPLPVPLFDAHDLDLLRQTCDEDPELYACARTLVSMTYRRTIQGDRRGKYDQIEAVVRRHMYGTEEEARQAVMAKKAALDAIPTLFPLTSAPGPAPRPPEVALEEAEERVSAAFLKTAEGAQQPGPFIEASRLVRRRS